MDIIVFRRMLSRVRRDIIRIFYGQSSAHVRDFGAVGGGVDDSAAINNAIIAAGDGGTVLFDAETVYTVARPVGRNGVGGGMALPAQLRGNGATLKAINEVTTTTTAPLSLGQTSVTVSSTAGFVVGAMIAFSTAGNAAVSGQTTITDVNPATNTISFNAFTDGFAVGASPIASGAVVSDVGTVLRFGAGLSRTQRLEVCDFIFDGNAANRTAQRHWAVTWGVVISKSSGVALKNVSFYDCEFNNFPGEGLFLDDPEDTKTAGCRFTSIFGNGVHSGGSGTGRAQRFTNNYFSQVFLANTGTAPTAQQYGHAGACIEASNGPQETIIAGNAFVDSQGRGVGGWDDASNVRVVVADNTFKNCRWGAFSIANGVAEFVAADNTITSCGIDLTESGAITSTHVIGSATLNWTITGNVFKDSVLVIGGSGRGTISGNSFDVAGLSLGAGYHFAAINLASSSVANVGINGNFVFAGLQVVTNTNLYGIRVIGTGIQVSGNFVLGGRYGIYCSSNITGCAILGNMLSDQRASVTPSAGILFEGVPTLSGVNIAGNTCHMPAGSNTAGWRGISFNGNGITANDVSVAFNVIRADATPSGHRAGIHVAMTSGGAGIRFLFNSVRMNSASHTAVAFDTPAAAGCHILGNRWVQGTQVGISGATLAFGTLDSNFAG